MSLCRSVRLLVRRSVCNQFAFLSFFDSFEGNYSPCPHTRLMLPCIRPCFPPALSSFGEINFPSAKANLMHEILIKYFNSPDDFDYDAAILDGAFLVYFLPPFPNQMFKQYSAKVHDFLNAYFQTVTRIDLVFDVYIENSLKAATRAKRERNEATGCC